MPKPIICLAEALCQYAELFRPCFSNRQYKYFVTVLLALVECQERRTLSALLRCVSPEGVSLSGLSRFFSKWQWSPQTLADIWLARFKERVTPLVQANQQVQNLRLTQCPVVKNGPGRPPKIKAKTLVTGFLIMDDSTHHKPKGQKMEGMGRHYSNTEKKLLPGHSLFGSLYSVIDQRTPLLPKLYRQKKVCEREGVVFQSKIELAVATIETFEPLADTATHVLVDSWFHCKALRKACRVRGWDLSGALKSNRRIRVTDAKGELQWQPLNEYVQGLSETDWQEAQWPSSAEGEPRSVYVHTLRTKVSKLGATLVVITRYHLEGKPGEIRYWGTTVVDATAQTVLDYLAKRWSIEVFFEDAKDLLGSDHYQLMSAVGVERFWAIIALLSSFLDEQRFLMSQRNEGTHYSWGACRSELQIQHRRNLLVWLENQFRERADLSLVATFLRI